MEDIHMSTQRNSNTSLGEELCIACGLCCTGHLFTYASLKDEEIQDAYALGLSVDTQNIPGERSFALPCPLYDGKCSIYKDPRKPAKCTSYKCQLLMDLEVNKIHIEQALMEVQHTKEMISEIERVLPEDANKNFCIELLPYLDALEKAGIKCDTEEDQNLLKAGMLLARYDQKFGVTQLFTNRRKQPSQRQR
jgi:hypothetical protein